MMKILSIDYGEKRIGFAVGDSTFNTQTPIKSIINHGIKDLQNIVNNLSDEFGIEKIIIGNPLNMDGSAGKFASRVKNVSKKLKQSSGLEISMVDERLSSFEAGELLAGMPVTLKKKKELMDSFSAWIILKRYMENL